MNRCKIKDCNKNTKRKNLCDRHYMQIHKFGRILERTHLDPNEYVIDFNKNCYEIYLYDKKYNHIASALVDAEDIHKIIFYKWHLSCGCAITKINNKNVLLHRLILDCPKELDVDHINHNRLDNKRNNIRICTTTQNSQNKKCLGISFHIRIKKWQTYIIVNGKYRHLGYFKTKQEALRVRHKAEKKYFGEFAYRRNND